MKKWIYSMFILLSTLVTFGNEDQLKEAERLYDARKYKQAIEIYQKLVDDGNKATALYFNLGNCYYRNNQLGYAIYYYELARKMDPNDKDVQINLGIAGSKTIDKIDAKENFFINAMKSNIVNVFTTNTWAWLSIMLALVTCVLFYVFYAGSTVNIRRIAFIAFMLLFVSTCIVYGLGYSALNSKYDNKYAIILSAEVNVKNEPNASGVLKFTLHEGTKVRITESNGDWLLIKLDNGNEGWVPQTKAGVI